MQLQSFATIFRREFKSYFDTPIAYVFLVIFLIMNGLFTFYLGQFYQREQANLVSFFTFLPWLYLFFMPAIAMRLWAEERRSGTLELLLTLPLPVGAIIIGKYGAAVAFAGLALVLTFPLWLTVNWLGNPDNGVIITGYLASFLMAASYLAIGSAMSAVTKNQVIAFILAVSACFLHLVAGLPMVLDFVTGLTGAKAASVFAGLSFLTHFDQMQKGLLRLSDLLFFGAVIGFWLFVNRVIVELKREAG